MKVRHRVRALALVACLIACLTVLGSCSNSNPTAIEVINASGKDNAGQLITGRLKSIMSERDDVVVTSVETPSMVSDRHLIILPSSDEKYTQIADEVKTRLFYSQDVFQVVEVEGNTVSNAADTVLVVLGSDVAYSSGEIFVPSS